MGSCHGDSECVRTLPPSVTGILGSVNQEISFIEKQCQEHYNQSDKAVPGLEDALDDGFLLCDVNVVREKLRCWNDHLFPGVRPYFALKCHPDEQVARTLATASCGFDCASLHELHLAKCVLDDSELGISNVIYANPQRSPSELRMAIDMGVTALTFDDEAELHKIHNTIKGDEQKKKQLQMILRLAVPDESSSVPLGEKFGIATDSDNVRSIADLALSLGLPIVGISFHCGSGCHDPQAYCTALKLARLAMDICNDVLSEAVSSGKEGVPKKCWILDIGGGFPGQDGVGGDERRFSTAHGDNNASESESSSDQNETSCDIAKVVRPMLDELFWNDDPSMKILAEPGRYFVEASFVMASKIYKVECLDGRYHYTIPHGVHGVFKDVILCGESFVPQALRLGRGEEKPSESELLPSTVNGPMKDVVCRDCSLPKLQVGDWLVFDRMGAYTMSIASRAGRPIVRYIDSIDATS